ncbi:MAG: hypothetical protein ACI8RZ_001243 [Myxococcota bacterium]|jgi:hypothetical protein
MTMLAIFATLTLLTGCDQNSDLTGVSEFADAFDEFSGDITIYASGDEITIETDGLPDHTSPYWSPDHELYVDPTVADEVVPGYIDDFSGSYTLTVPASPEKASASSSTSLGPIGIAVSGAPIYNDEEGQSQPIDSAIGGLDYTGAHTGPQSYHYHLETTAWSQDDEELIGIIADGFLLYGRKCNSTGGHPDDLDDSGGHTATTQHSESEIYHYHIVNEAYLGEHYILFAGDYQGSPSSIQ